MGYVESFVPRSERHKVSLTAPQPHPQQNPPTKAAAQQNSLCQGCLIHSRSLQLRQRSRSSQGTAEARSSLRRNLSWGNHLSRSHWQHSFAAEFVSQEPLAAELVSEPLPEENLAQSHSQQNLSRNHSQQNSSQNHSQQNLSRSHSQQNFSWNHLR